MATSKIKAGLPWNTAGTITSLNSPLSFPSSAKELFLVVAINGILSYAYKIYIPIIENGYSFYGYESTTADYGSCVVQIDANTVQIVTLKYKGADSTVNATVKYR